eukprot:jgi/Ulvmu1/3051/UM015_0091.1
MNTAAFQLQDLLGIVPEAAWLQRARHDNVDRNSLLKAFLLSDLAQSSTGCLPRDWQNHPQLQGTFVLQMNEVVNIAAPVRDRYKPDSGRRCLKLHLTDGKQTAWAIELSPCAALNCNLAAGCKVILTNPVVHRGYFMLMGSAVQVLGGSVQRLEAARQRLLEHWNKPLGCNLLSVQARRTFQQLMLEAVDAAWPQGTQAGVQPALAPGAPHGPQQEQQLQQQLLAPAPNPAAIGSHHAPGAGHPAAAHSAGAPPLSPMQPGYVQQLPPQPRHGANVGIGAAAPAPVAGGHAHPAIHAHPCVQPHAPPLAGTGGTRLDFHQHHPCSLQLGHCATDGPAIRVPGPAANQPYAAASTGAHNAAGPPRAGQSTLPSTGWRPPAHPGAGTGAATATASGSDPAQPQTGHSHDAAPYLGASCDVQTAVPSAHGHEPDYSDVIMIDSDDDHPDQAPGFGAALPEVGAPGALHGAMAAMATHVACASMPEPSVQRDGTCTRSGPLAALRRTPGQQAAGDYDSDDEAPLVSRPRRVTGGKSQVPFACSGYENSSQGNREGCQVLRMETISDVFSHAKAHPGREENFQYQVAATFTTDGPEFSNEIGSKGRFYYAPGKICGDSQDKCSHDGIVKPEFLSACGLGDGPVDFINYLEQFTQETGQDEAHAPLVGRMDSVIERLRDHGTLLLEKRQKFISTWHVSLPAAAVADLL